MSTVGGVGGPGQVGLDRIRQGLESALGAKAEGGTSFADTLKQALGEVSTLQENAQDSIAAFVSGKPVELHQVMAAAEEAGIALEMLIEIRNKLTEAYRALVQMQS